MHFMHFLSNNFKYASDAQNDMYSSNSLCSMLRGRLAFEIIYVRKRIPGNTRKKTCDIWIYFQIHFYTCQCFLIGDISGMGEKRNTDRKRVQRQ